EDIKLVVVTKNIAVEQIIEVMNLGVTHIGENRIQEARKKFDELKDKNIVKHFIGHLQTNKVKFAVEMFDMIQSVDSIHLAEEIHRQAKKINKIQDCLIELKVSEEETKYGCLPEKIQELIERIGALENLHICGLMAMAPFFDNPELTRPYFRRAKEIFEKYITYFTVHTTHPYLSMGMSNDFEIAIEEGANMVRIGTAIFKG
ncbi:MAG: YggS family pyridoxal phosphate-dependent enzyme, partial [Elusimicrobiota bacterium]|nr:YggS family pyridoxal phosphate-dependent enzyme [Elusimicrobiota bacterium]